jgi:hypothetical protein
VRVKKSLGSTALPSDSAEAMSGTGHAVRPSGGNQSPARAPDTFGTPNSQAVKPSQRTAILPSGLGAGVIVRDQSAETNAALTAGIDASHPGPPERTRALDARLNVPVIPPTRLKRRSELLKAMIQENTGPTPSLGGFDVMRASRETGPRVAGTELSTPENKTLIARVLTQLESLETATPGNRFDIDEFQRNIEKGDTSTEQLFAFIWHRPDVQEIVREVKGLAVKALDEGCPQGLVLSFLHRYGQLMSIPFNLSTGQQYIYALGSKEFDSDGVREHEVARRLLAKAKSSPELVSALQGSGLLESFPAMGSTTTLKEYYESNGLQSSGKAENLERLNRVFRLVLIDAVVDQYSLVRFFHHGIAPVGVFATSSTRYDDLISNNLAASQHDFSHWSRMLDIPAYFESFAHFTALRDASEILFLVTDKVRDVLPEERRKRLDSLLFNAIHETSDGKPTPVPRAFEMLKMTEPAALQEALLKFPPEVAQEVESILNDYRSFDLKGPVDQFFFERTQGNQ